MGFSTKKAVFIIYAASMVLCILSLLLVNLQNRIIGIFLLALAITAFCFLKRLGYLKHIAPERIYGWIKDVSDEAGFSHERRSFLNMQLEISGSKTYQELWQNTCKALEMLDFDMSKILLWNHANGRNGNSDFWRNPGGPINLRKGIAGSMAETSDGKRGNRRVEWVWTHNGFDIDRDGRHECLLKLELPLLDDRNNNLGMLWLVKDLKRNSVSHYTLRRIEHLRRSVTQTLDKLRSEGGVGSRE